MTPRRVTIKLIKKIPASKNDSWCDPCYGNGVFYENFPTNNKKYYEINLGRDYLKCNKKYDWNVTNIPFSKPKEFIFKMAKQSNKGFGILCLANSMTATRLKFLEQLGFHIHSLTILYIRKWGFGYRTDFYVFTKNKNKRFNTIVL